MTAKKEKLLNETYKRFMQTSMYDLPLDTANEFVDGNVMGYGTANDEKVLSLSDYLRLITRQREQAAGIEMHIEETPVRRQIAGKEDTAIFVDEIKITMILGGDKHLLNVRLTSVFEYSGQQWKVIHWHASKADNTEGTDTWHINEWKRKNEELQKLVDEKTADLVLKNRDLEIESSLERVRTVAMGMNNAKDLLGICEVLYKELQKLGFTDLRNSMINIHNDEKESLVNYDFSDFAGAAIASVDYNIYHSVQTLVKQVRSSKDAFIEYVYTGQELADWKAFRKKIGEYDDPRVENITSLYYYFYSIGIGSIGISAFNAIGEEKLEVLKRFRNVFDLAYKRYVDITNAEAQAKEAHIEAALEKVRSRSLAMQKSEELKEVIQVVYEQFVHLNVNTEHAGFVIDYKQRDDRLIWVAGKRGVPSQLTIPYFDCDYYNSFNEAKEKGWDFFATNLGFEEKNSFYRELFKYIPGLPEDEKEFYFNCPGLAISTVLLENVALYIENFEGILYSDEDNAILMRFGKVFQQTYTRFLDLQKAEAQAREAQIEAALERVRGRAMAMQSSEELNTLIGAVFTELIKLDVSLTRCAIVIYETEGKASRQFMVNVETPSEPSSFFVGHADIPYLNAFIKAWKDRSVKWEYILEGKDKFMTDEFLLKETELSRLPDFVIAAMRAPERVHISASFNNFGCVTLASLDPLSDEHFDILLRFAKVFDLTYTRFNDLKIAEAHALQAEEDLQKLHAEKKRTEEALAELQSTQKQLIQSEKMASLGELTAGIAHEIQNPLNFVNNFSEVSSELIQEMVEEVAKGNYDEVKAIAEDLKGNLEKINHHGKRADGIVKGMLQHSRSSSATKEPTDINKLADEYLRLAYHGLRAKDKSFNATMKTDFDESIGSINIIPQDIGRVILNLITNAFYVVNEKKIQQPKEYEPTVSVSTKKLDDKVQVSVKDNGNGIPPKVLDKIFQPFFTTKPTGQGTGLGLSLSYDIVKAHGGEIKVETEAGEGSAFIIQLPV